MLTQLKMDKLLDEIIEGDDDELPTIPPFAQTMQTPTQTPTTQALSTLDDDDMSFQTDRLD